jgi:hypothetical protein
MTWIFFFVVSRELLEVFRLEDLIAIHAAQVIDPVPPHEEFGARVLTSGHSGFDYPYSNERPIVVKPPVSGSSLNSSFFNLLKSA